MSVCVYLVCMYELGFWIGQSKEPNGRMDGIIF